MINKEDRNYLFWIAVHLGLGGLIFLVPFLSKIYGYLIILCGLIYIVRKRNQNHEVLEACAYVVGAEVLLRMTDGNPMYEFSKYVVIGYLLVAMYYKGFSKNAVVYWVFLVLLIPGLLISTQVIDFDERLRKSISFNISGPVCLGIASLYMYRLRISFERLNNILVMLALPIVATMTYLIFYTPSVRDVVTGTSSNFETSGGFGPNQVATMLGLGVFIFFVRMILFSSSKLVLAVNLFLFLNIAYRGLVTFSRGGMITSIVMIFLLMVVLYFKLNTRGKIKFHIVGSFFLLLLAGIWIYSINETDGLIEKRYANQDASGRVKESRLSGREDIMESDIIMFKANPVFGVGVARSPRMRGEIIGKSSLSHNELTRMLAEHGAFGIMAMLVLFVTPLILYLDNRMHLYMLCFLVFWLLTINHAAMRLAVPAFVYALSILKVYNGEENLVRRE